LISMFRSVFTKSLRDQYRGLIGWSFGLVSLVMIMAALWPSVRDMPDLEKFLRNYPEAMRKLFNVRAIGTGKGFMNAELFTFMLPVLFIVFGIGRGARLLAGEEQAGTLDVLLTAPLSRTRILLQKAAALAVSVLVLGAVLLATTLASAQVAHMEIGVAQLAWGVAALTLLGVEFGWLALAIGAATGRRSLAIGVAGAMATAAYVLYVMGAIVEAVEPWRILSPFHQALSGGPIGGGIAAYAWLATGAVIALAASIPIFDRRDVRV
jgi:beta-exotoxin I transport system permease protein